MNGKCLQYIYQNTHIYNITKYTINISMTATKQMKKKKKKKTKGTTNRVMSVNGGGTGNVVC